MTVKLFAVGHVFNFQSGFTQPFGGGTSRDLIRAELAYDSGAAARHLSDTGC
ncbi:hypothetical protein H8A97_33980 [Bradyrhizobium sp. Arg62]|uniref:hypothetical protein n=1 Tax=Bradyrhizobium TaxID=374 RepID=UPI001E3F8F95|nr:MULTISPECIES: hypothetical protein [Bradyrhizobium]MCC8940253.1 hypothetical protein [Bradyrhizobium ivorense]MCC8949968.1 hypothetical protein [Bradyrhizobium brasilense]